MSYFKTPCTIDGIFTEIEFRKSFEYRKTSNSWALENGLKFEIAIGPLEEVRFAKILKTVAYVAVSEDDYSKPIMEKWKIKHGRYHGNQ